MYYRKLYNENVPLLLTLLVAGAPAVLVRICFISKSDIITANLVCIMFFVICAIFFHELIILLESIEPVIFSWVAKIQNKAKPVDYVQRMDNNIANEEEIHPWKTEVDNIRQDAKNQIEKKMNDKIDLFLKYSHQTMAPYVTDDELLYLDKYIRHFAFKESLPDDLIPIRPKELINYDMNHFGWNMANYFKNKKKHASPWLKIVFFQLQNEEEDNITKKLRHSGNKNYKIPIIKDIPKYLKEKES